MAPKLWILWTAPAVIPLTTARFGMWPARPRRSRATARLASTPAALGPIAGFGAGVFMAPKIGVTAGGMPASAPDGGLPSGADGLFLPLLLTLVAVVAGILLVTFAIRRVTARQSSEAAESDTDLPGSIGYTSGRDRNLPRWLDPSVAAARFRTDTTSAVRVATAVAAPPSHLPLVFAGPIDETTERMRVRYDGVPLLDRPDDVIGRTYAELDGGDEVEVLERDELWARVRTPSGQAGWVLSMTISALPAETAEDDPVAADTTQPEPPPSVDEPPTLESLLEAIVAQRLARQELPMATDLSPAHADRPPATHADPPPSAPRQPRSRKPRTDQPAPARPARRKLAIGPEPEPPALAEPAPTAPARPRSRKPRSDRPAA
jgi:SH3 domain-containing protein